MKGFEIVQSGRTTPATTNQTGQQVINLTRDHKGQALDIAQDAIPRIIDLANSYMEIQKIQATSEAEIARMQETRKQLLAEAEAYVVRKQADTQSVVEQMEQNRLTLEKVRLLLQDFYAHNDGKMTGEDFCKVITEIAKNFK